MFKKASGAILLLFLIAMPARPQEAAASDPKNLSSYIGMKLDELIGRCGPPQTVYASRGQETWQDDVVFVYADANFYLFKDRVWQLGIKSAYGVEVGDPKPAAVLALGEEAADQGDFLLLPLPSVGWPLALRLNFNAAGRVAAIYIYRPDL